MNGNEKTIGLKNLPESEILSRFAVRPFPSFLSFFAHPLRQLLRNTSGAKVTHRSRSDVYSENKLAGQWTPFQMRPGADGRQ